MPKEIKKRKVVEDQLNVESRPPIPPPPRKTPIGSTILQYVAIIVAVGFLFWGRAFVYKVFHFDLSFTIIPLSGPAVLFFSLACAFTWVEIMKWGVTKPFTCIKCLTGWIALLLALIFHVDHPYFYLPAGLFIGAVFEAIKMRYL